MNPATASYAPALERDVQAELDARGVAIDRVGVRGLRYPISVACRDLPPQTVVATWELTVSLLPTQRGTHMSRFVETLDEWAANPLDGSALLSMLDDLRGRFDGCEAHASVSFTIFLERQAPVSGMSSKLAIECRLDAQRGEETAEVTLGVRVPVTSLCPCSKEISDYGAHSQRGYVTIEALAESSRPLSFEDLVDVAEASGSAPIYPLLKRPGRAVRDDAGLRHASVRRGCRAHRVTGLDGRPAGERVRRRSREPGEHPRPRGRGDGPLGASVVSGALVRVITTCTSRKVVGGQTPRRAPVHRRAAPPPHGRRRAPASSAQGRGVDHLGQGWRDRGRRTLEAYDESFTGSDATRFDAKARPLASLEISAPLGGKPARLTLVLAGNEYFDAARLDEPVAWVAPTMALVSPRSASRIPPHPILRAVAVGQAEARRFSLPLTLLKGEIAKRLCACAGRRHRPGCGRRLARLRARPAR